MTERLANLKLLLAQEEASAKPTKAYIDDLKRSIQWEEQKQDRLLIIKSS